MAERERLPVETRDLPPRVLWALVLGFGAFVLLSALGLRLFFQPDLPWSFSRLAKPEPVLQISPAADYARYIDEKRAELADTGWVDHDAGLVEIPIEEAMRLVAEGHRADVAAEAAVKPEPCTGAACPAEAPTTGPRP